MTKLLEQAMSKAQTLPPEMQDEMARLMLIYAGTDEDRRFIRLTPQEEADLDEADREVARGEVVSEDDVDLILAKYKR